MVGMEMGVDEDRFKDEALETPLRPLGVKVRVKGWILVSRKFSEWMT